MTTVLIVDCLSKSHLQFFFAMYLCFLGLANCVAVTCTYGGTLYLCQSVCSPTQVQSLCFDQTGTYLAVAGTDLQ